MACPERVRLHADELRGWMQRSSLRREDHLQLPQLSFGNVFLVLHRKDGCEARFTGLGVDVGQGFTLFLSFR